MACDAVYAWIVVMIAFANPMRLPITSTIGVMQFVVQLAHEMMDGLPSGRFDP